VLVPGRIRAELKSFTGATLPDLIALGGRPGAPASPGHRHHQRTRPRRASGRHPRPGRLRPAPSHSLL